MQDLFRTVDPRAGQSPVSESGRADLACGRLTSGGKRKHCRQLTIFLQVDTGSSE